jgi:hypothetical protein
MHLKDGQSTDFREASCLLPVDVVELQLEQDLIHQI